MELAFLSPSPMELAVIAVIALLVLGPARLPEAAKALGKGMKEMRDSFSGAMGNDDDDRADDDLDLDEDDEDDEDDDMFAPGDEIDEDPDLDTAETEPIAAADPEPSSETAPEPSSETAPSAVKNA